MDELERRATEARKNSDHWFYVEKDFESAMKLDIRAKTLDEVIQLIRGSSIDGSEPPP